MQTDAIRRKLVHALTQYDVRQSKGKRYNHYAMGQYLMRVDNICADIAAGAEPRAAIVAAFNGALLRCTLKAIGEAHTPHDDLAKGWTYRPVAAPQDD